MSDQYLYTNDKLRVPRLAKGKNRRQASIVEGPEDPVILIHEAEGVGFSLPQKFTGSLALQITGDAGAIVVQLFTSIDDPEDNAVWAPVFPADELVEGNPSTGMPVQGLYEPGSAWWMVQIITLTGGDARVSLRGKEGL